MKTPEEIAREIVDAAWAHGFPCRSGHEAAIGTLCAGCLRSMIAAAIVAERTPGTTGGCGVHRTCNCASVAVFAPAPACARCGGSGVIRWQTAPGRQATNSCPECRGKP